MTCPNCGAEMERHAFTHVCPFCGYISPDETPKGKGSTNDNRSYSPYENILNHLDAIKQSEFLELIQKTDCFECFSAKPFYPYDGHFNLDKSLEIHWYARVTKHSFSIFLLAKSYHSDIQNQIIIKANDDILTLKQNGECRGYSVFPLTIDDFLYICDSQSIELATIRTYSNYDEFIIYSHRFFHFVIDNEKYLYSIYQPLIIDLS